MDAKVLMGMARIVQAVDEAKNREGDNTPDIDAKAAQILDTHSDAIEAALKYCASQMARR